MRSLAHFPRFSVEFQREELPVETLSPSRERDQDWRYVDKEGHGHFWEGSELPTLEWIVTGTRWVGDEYDASEVVEGEYRCPLCREVVEPGWKLSYGPRHVPGPTTVTITIEDEKFYLRPEGYAKAIEKWAEFLRKEQMY